MCFLLLKYIDFVRWGSVVWEISLDWGVYKVRFGCGEEGGGRLISGDEREILFCFVMLGGDWWGRWDLIGVIIGWCFYGVEGFFEIFGSWLGFFYVFCLYEIGNCI